MWKRTSKESEREENEFKEGEPWKMLFVEMEGEIGKE